MMRPSGWLKGFVCGGLVFGWSALSLLRADVVSVAPDGRHLMREDGAPFFWLGDTAWELLHRLNETDSDRYLEDRSAKGFTIVLTVLLAPQDGLRVPNAQGDLPLMNLDPTRPNEAYFAHVDRVLAKAESLGLVVGLLPTWGDKFRLMQSAGPEVFTPQNARVYGRRVGERYRERNLVWILGGDRAPADAEDEAIIDAMAAGLREAVGNRQLITYHPWGGTSSSKWFHERDWLDLNLIQSGHALQGFPVDESVARDRQRSPAKPVLDAEPCYEDHPIDWKPELGWYDAADVRRAAYWAILAGAAGHTYGHHSVWQMWRPGLAPVSAARTPWEQALDYPGAWQMGVLRRFFESVDWTALVPRNDLVGKGPAEPLAKVVAASDPAGVHLVAYTPWGESFSLDTGGLRPGILTARWIDPRTGHAIVLGELKAADAVIPFDPPGDADRSNDWILVVETDG